MHQVGIKIMNESYLFSSWFWYIFRDISRCISIHRCRIKFDFMIKLRKIGFFNSEFDVEVFEFSDIPINSLASFKVSFSGLRTKAWHCHRHSSLDIPSSNRNFPPWQRSIRLGYCWIPSSSKNSEVSKSGWSPSGKGDWEVLKTDLFQTSVRNLLSSCQ